MNKKIIFGLIISVLFLSFVSATGSRVAYVVEDNTFNNVKHQTIYSILNEFNLERDTIKDSEVPTTDFSQYSIVIVADNINNEVFIPYREKNTIFFDTDSAIDAWNGVPSRVGTTQRRNIRSTANSNPLFTGVTIFPNNDIQIYNTFVQPITMNYLKSPLPSGVTRIAITDSSSESTLVYTQEEVEGEFVKTLFFGAPEFSKWDTDARQIFRNSLEWVLQEVDQDGDGFVMSEDCNDNDFSVNPDADEIPYDGVDQNCDGIDLLDVDYDGFCEQNSQITSTILQCPLETGLFGTDCDDSDEETNRNSPFPELNCVNDAPTIIEVYYEGTYSEGDLVEIIIDAYDPEDNTLQYTVDFPLFQQLGDSLIWQTTFSDSGFYELLITVSDGEFSDSQQIAFEITNENRGPIFTGVNEIELDEDSVSEINLSQIFEDEDNEELSFEIEILVPEENVLVELNSDQLSVESQNNFFGDAGLIRITASDGFEETSEDFTLFVSPVNDAPVQFEIIENIQMNEDTALENAINLHEHFSDIDSELDFSVSGNINIQVEINNGLVSIIPDEDFFGTEELVFTASDGEFSTDSNSVLVQVSDVGEPPVFSSLDCETSVDEDSLNTCTLEATDFENDLLEFSVVSSENAECSINGDVLTYLPNQDFSGDASCVLIVSDDDGSDIATLEFYVSPVNDAPIQIQTLSNIQLDEDGEYENFLNLYDYFLDVDSELDFSFSGNSEISVLVDEFGIVSFYLSEDYTGSENVTFSATDGEFSLNIETTVFVNEVGDVPVLSELECETELVEENEYECNLSATDAEGNNVSFIISSHNKLECLIEGNILRYKSEVDFFGDGASCTIQAQDQDGLSEPLTLDVYVENVNDAPTISKATPNSNIVRVLENTSKQFSIESFDVDNDSETVISWFLDGVEKKTEAADSSDLTISQGQGSYLLEAVISDSEYSKSHLWTVIFGPSTDFTCSEVGGFVCSESQACSSSLISVKDTNVCCKTSCIPSFRRADACEILGNNLQVDITNPEVDEDLEIGKTVRVDVEVRNNLDDEDDFDIEAHIFDLSRERSEESVETELSLDANRRGIARLDLPIPADLETADSFAIFVKVDGEECNQDYVLVNIERPEKKLLISKFELPDNAVCEDIVSGRIVVENIGNDDFSDAVLSITNPNFGLKISDTFDIDEFEGDNDKFSKDFTFLIPSGINSETYTVRADLSYEGKRETQSLEFEVVCKDLELENQVSAQTESPVFEEDFSFSEEILSLNRISGSKSINLGDKRPNLMLIAQILVIDFMLIAAVGILHAAESKRRLRREFERTHPRPKSDR